MGTVVNVAAILLGTAAGVLAGDRLHARVREGVMRALGLVTILIGVDSGLAAFRAPLTDLTRASVVLILGSVLVGTVIGESVHVEERLDRLGERLKRRFGRRQARFTEGFVAASLVFLVGPMAILGSIQDGLRGDWELLGIKSLLDGFASMGFAATLGIGVGFSVLPIAVYQGSITLAAASVAGAFTPEMVAAISASGGVLIMGIGLRLLEIAPVRVGNMLPSLVIAPAAVWVVQRF